MPEWSRQREGNRRSNYSTSYGDDRSASGAGDSGGTDYDGKSCSDFHQLPGRGVEDVESLTMLHQIGLNGMDEDEESDRND